MLISMAEDDVRCWGRTPVKKNRALPELPLPPLPPIRATCTTYFGCQKRRFSVYYRTK